MYFAGNIETNDGIRCKVCNKSFASEKANDVVVPSAKEPLYICVRNIKHDCKIGLCCKHYNETALNSDASLQNKRCHCTHANH